MDQIDGCISYLDDMWRHASILGAVSQVVLIELTIKLLKELKEIKEKEGK